MRAQILTATGAAALLMLSQSAQANTLVSTIVGAYDNGCSAVSCAPSKPATGITNFASNGIGGADTPSLFIYNPTGTAFTNVSLKLTGYQGINNGVTQVVAVASIAAHTVYKLTWGTGGPLFVNDYDDSQGSSGHYPGPVTPSSGGVGVCSAVANALCAQVGNFAVSFSADIGTTPISSNFSDQGVGMNGSPSGTVGQVFVPWEGVSPQGWSESFADNHSGSTPGPLADIFTGKSHTGGTPAPEPTSMALFGAGLGALALTRRRRKSS